MTQQSETRRRLEAECCVTPCPMTAGYYVGGGQYICWLHALIVPGLMNAVRKQPLVGLWRKLDELGGE